MHVVCYNLSLLDRCLIFSLKMAFNIYKLSILAFVIGLRSIQAQIELFGDEPLLTGATSFTFVISTKTLIKPTPCFVSHSNVSQCRRKRGFEEKPELIQFDEPEFVPSAVVG